MNNLGQKWNNWRSRRSKHTQVLIFWVGLFILVGVVDPLWRFYDWIRAEYGGINEDG